MKSIYSKLLFSISIALFLLSCTGGLDSYKLLCLERDELELAILPDVGGRIVYLGLKGHGNILKSDSSLWIEHPSQKPDMNTVHDYKPYWGYMVWPSPMDEWWRRQDLYPDKKANGDRWPPDPYLIYGEFAIEIEAHQVVLTGPKSPLTGVQFTHTIELLASNRVRFHSRLTNIRNDTVSWGIWTNMQLHGASRCYVPMRNADTLWFKQNVTSEQDSIPYALLDGYFTFLPENVQAGKTSYMTKVCIHPGEPWLTAFKANNVINGDKKMNRRTFLKNSAGSAALLAVPHMINSKKASAENKSSDMPQAMLGRIGKKVSRFGVGCGIFIAREFSAQEIATVVETALEVGVNYIDTAPNYPGVQKKLGPIIKPYRDQIFLVSKIEEATYDGAWSQIKKSMQEMQTDFLDLVFFHSFGDTNRWPDTSWIIGKEGALTALIEAKKQGVIGGIGISGHNRPSRFLGLINTGEIDVLMNVANFAMQHTYGFETKVWPRARALNMGLVAMKVLGGVHPVTNKEFRFHIDEYDNAIRYALSIPGVATAVIGMRDPFEVEEAVATVKSLQPLSESEMADLTQKGLALVQQQPSIWREAWGPED
ncbi:DUF4380 domain-containing protein [candidate division KSB1 bacterium]|nr:DUF4380 domain-containing protein [candidate division KSB1 bacterium]